MAQKYKENFVKKIIILDIEKIDRVVGTINCIIWATIPPSVPNLFCNKISD